MRPGAVLVDHTTVSAKIARRLAEEAASKGLLAVDAPVSGGQAGAESGQLAIMFGGSAEAFSAAEPAMQAYAKRIVHVGEAGSRSEESRVGKECVSQCRSRWPQ